MKYRGIGLWNYLESVILTYASWSFILRFDMSVKFMKYVQINSTTP